MHIGIDARFFGPFGKGLGRYTQKLIESLEELDTENRYTIFLRKENFDDYKPKKSNFKKVCAHFEWYSLEEQTKWPQFLSRYKCDLVHFPHFNVPLSYKGRYVVTIHDLIILHFPTRRATTLDPIKYAAKQFAYKVVIKNAVKKAKKIITVSEFSKRDIVKHFNLDKKRVIVTYEAADMKVQNSVEFQILKDKFNINKPYILYVGNAYPHKNIEKLVESFAKTSEKNPDVQLVLVGKMDYFYQRIKQLVDDNNYKNIIFPGFVTDEELQALYENCRVYTFPSLYEGFGLPPLEAMAKGAPVISSREACMPEILKEGALFYNPYSVDDIEQKTEEILHNEEVRKDLIEKGSKVVSSYSWEKCGGDTLKVYQSILNEFKR